MTEAKKAYLNAEQELAGKWIIWVLTVVVMVLVGMMRNPRFHVTLPNGLELTFLPPIHALLNSMVATCLVCGLRLIKAGMIAAHQRMMTTALVLSGLFLLCYVAYHFTSNETAFGGQGWIRPVYFFLLISHIALAAISFPCILRTFLAAWAGNWQEHRAWTRWVFPMWLYVAVTGPVCYLMLKPYY